MFGLKAAMLNRDLEHKLLNGLEIMCEKLSGDGPADSPDINQITDEKRRGILIQRMRSTQTGVKGVLNDYYMNEQLKEVDRQEKEVFRKTVLTRMAEGCKIAADEDVNRIENKIADIDDDEEFFSEYRRKRLEEMGHSTHEPELNQQFNWLNNNKIIRDVTIDNFIEEIENPSYSYVVVHSYHPDLPSCDQLDEYLQDIHDAKLLPHVNIIKMNVNETDMDLDPVSYPILSIYKNGEVVAALVALEHALGINFKKHHILNILQQHMQMS